MLRLPDSLRDAFKEPFGPVYTETEALLSAIDETATNSDSAANDASVETATNSDSAANDASVETASGDVSLIAVGDVVTYHLLEAGRQPDVAVIDGKTEREAVDDQVAATLADPTGLTRRVSNPPAELSEAMLVALQEAIEAAESVTITVDGEEDLATLPAIVAAARGSSVVYGQPGVGMVHVAVTEAQTAEARRLLGEFDGDTEAAVDLLRD